MIGSFFFLFTGFCCYSIGGSCGEENNWFSCDWWWLEIGNSIYTLKLTMTRKKRNHIYTYGIIWCSIFWQVNDSLFSILNCWYSWQHRWDCCLITRFKSSYVNADSCLWNAKEWCTENYNMRLVIHIFPKLNMYDCWVGEATCWLPSYCIRIKMSMLQLCVKHNKTWKMLSVIEWRLGNMLTYEKKKDW